MSLIKFFENRFITFLLITVLMISNINSAFAAETSRAAKISDLLGKVSVLKSGGEKTFTAFRGMSLSQGDSISTGKDSWVEIEIDDDKLVKIAENTQLGVSELQGSAQNGDDKTGLKLWFGKVWTNIKKKLNVRSKYEIRTPKTVMGVRGTQFYVGEEGGRTLVAVLEGRVFAVTYASEQRPDGTVLEHAVETFLEKNQQTVIDSFVHPTSAITVQPVKLETLPSAILEEIKKNPEGIDQTLIQQIDKVIEEKKTEEANQDKIQQQLEQSQQSAPHITEDPVVSPPAPPTPSPAPSGGSPTHTPEAAVSTISASNGSITVTFNQALASSPSISDIGLKRLMNSEAQTRTIRSIEQVNSTTFKLLDYPLQPGNSILSYNYSVSYKGSSYIDSNTVQVQPLKSASVSAVGTSTITSGSTLQIAISDIVDQNDAVINSNGIFDNSVFSVRITSDLESAATATFNNVAINHNGTVTSPALGICLTSLGTHTLTVELNGKVLTDSLLINVESNTAPSSTIRVNSVKRISFSTAGGDPNSYSDSVMISRDGKYANFSSFASNIVTGDTNNARDIFVHDVLNNSNRRINLNTSGNQTSNGAGTTFITGNGNYAVFVSRASDLVSTDSNAADDIFLRDLITNTNYLVSLSDQNAQVSPGGGFFANPKVSDNGRFVAFTYTQDNLVQGDTNGQWDVFVRDRQSNTTSLVSVSDSGETGSTSSHCCSISGDGKYIAFSSDSVLAPGASGFGIYIRDLTNNTTKWMTKGSDAFLSSNGRFITFSSSETDIVAGDTNGNEDIFVMDRDKDNNGIYDEAGKTEIKRVSVSSTGEQANYNCYKPQISDDGRYVTFYSSASNLIKGDTNNAEDVFIHDCTTNVTKRVSISAEGSQANNGSYESSISGDGKYVVFKSSASNLVSGDNNNNTDIFLAELLLDAPLDTTPPTAPANTAVSNLGPSWVKISWDASTDNLAITNYDIFRGLSSSGPFNKIASVSGTALSYWDTTLSEGTQYYYSIKATNEDGLSSPTPSPLSVTTLNMTSASPQIVPLAAGQYHSVYKKSDGTVWSWGDNSKGQLGIGSPGSIPKTSVVSQVYSPDGISALTDIAAVEAGQYFTIALKNDGTVWTWGDNGYGQLGTNTATTSRDISGQVTGLSNIKAVSAGSWHVAALRSDGTVWTWGRNNYGQLGDGNTTDKSTPTPVISPDGTGYLTGIIAIAAGESHTAALRNDGTVWVFGNNIYGQLGNGATNNSSNPIPVQVPQAGGLPSNIASITSGANYIMALTADGYVWAWGENYTGQLGDNTYTCRYSPVQVKDSSGTGTLSNISVINPGGYHSLAVSDEGYVFAWGNNNRGKLGNNDTLESEQLLPVSVVGEGGSEYLSGIVFVAAAKDHSLALRNDGTVLAWGDGYSGQLGNSSYDTRYFPVAAN